MRKNKIVYDFGGWATKSNLRCSDGRTIMNDAFKMNDGQTVPLVWNHQHNSPDEVLGHALLENRGDGVYCYCTFNRNSKGRTAKELVRNGDVKALSIYANQLQQNGGAVIHGNIREVSLVLAGANPGAYIDSVIAHGADSDEEAEIYTGLPLELYHSDDYNEGEINMDEEMTIQDVLDTLDEDQLDAVEALLNSALEEQAAEYEDIIDDYADEDYDDEDYDDEDYDEDDDMKHNAFDNDYMEDDFLSHAETEEIFGDATRYGSLKDSVLAHGIDNIDYMFPEAQSLNGGAPDFISREQTWVRKVLDAVHRSPFSRVKSLFANITEEEARAKGYIKGNLKKEEVFSMLKRTTTPTTIYKKQKLDRDDVIDIRDFDVVAWIKGEMRMMLDEEIARAILIGDGRLTSSDEKINENNVRPIMSDNALFSVKKAVSVAHGATDEAKAKAFIKGAIKARKDYRGSGNPTLFCTEDLLTDMLLIEDAQGRMIYESQDKLTSVLRVKEIVTVPVFENIVDSNGKPLMGIIVNLEDYNVGADRGGEVSLFDDFDIDFNQQKYLIETRCSGAMVKPFAAIVLTCDEAAS